MDIQVAIRKSPEYYPIAQGILENANVKYLGDDGMDKNTIVFHNRPMNGSAWWMCDLREPEDLPDAKPSHIFLCNTEYIDRYRKKYGCNVTYMPQTGLNSFGNSKRIIDWNIVFIGNTQSNKYHSNRQEIIDYLGAKVINGQRFTKDTSRIYRYTPISLAISPQAAGYTSNRLYNILSSRGFCLTLWFPGIERLFENHKHLVWFKTKEEAMGLAQYYLKHEKDRKEIARNGFSLYTRKHTIKHRLENMQDVLSGKTEDFYGFI